MVNLESHAKVVGKVVRADGSPLASAPVIFAPKRADGAVQIQITGDTPTTGADGAFSADVEAGKHVLLVLGDGPMPAVKKDIEVAVGQTLDVGTLKAEPPPAQQQKPIRVSASP
jgi:hypothetical protein